MQTDSEILAGLEETLDTTTLTTISGELLAQEYIAAHPDMEPEFDRVKTLAADWLKRKFDPDDLPAEEYHARAEAARRYADEKFG